MKTLSPIHPVRKLWLVVERTLRIAKSFSEKRKYILLVVENANVVFLYKMLGNQTYYVKTVKIYGPPEV